MRRLWIKVSLVVASLLIFLGLMSIALGAFGWVSPGNPLFPLQDRLEQAMVIGSSTRKAERSLNLVERRIEDLQARAGTSHELVALQALGTNIERAHQLISAIPEAQAYDLVSRLVILLQQVDPVLTSLSELPNNDETILSDFRSKLDGLITAITGEVQRSNQATHQAEQIAQAGVVADGAAQARAFFPLTEGHAGLACLDCHITGQFEGTNTTCVGCHVGMMPGGHYRDACELCHTATNWKNIIWDHDVDAAENCFSCHEWTAPLGHFPGQCAECHVTSGWIDGTTYHTEPSNCWGCHAEEAPNDHYLEQCSSCHTTNNWTETEYTPINEINHTENIQLGHVDARCAECHGEARCSSCHDSTRPVDHYAGQCSQCHVTDDWHQVTFLHIPTSDCRSCHADTAPANHYSGQCSTCHTFDGWPGAIFNHTGYSDCRGCHASTAPGNHYPTQCSNCHNPSGWTNITFSHTGLTDCANCHAGTAPPGHYIGQCSLCHNPSGWTNVNFNHTGLTDCISCHADDVPPNHYDLPCSVCHTPTSWSEVNFDHVGADDCISCHEDDRPDNHPLAQCSICHNTNSWEDVDD